MIVVRVELWSAITGKVRELARMSISNEGTSDNPHVSDYYVATYRGRDKATLDRALKDRTTTRTGRVLKHRRLDEHVWNLVAKGLSSMGYGK